MGIGSARLGNLSCGYRQPSSLTEEVLLPSPSPDHVVDWVRRYLGDLACDEPVSSPRFRGTQAAADEALERFDVRGYAKRRNQVWPVSARGASGLSPWIRHGLLSLPRVWDFVGEGPAADVAKFRDELLWAEYSRHLYARLGFGLAGDLRASRGPAASPDRQNPWDRSMACVSLVLRELEDNGWIVNQTRMWLASQWSVRHGARWQEGEDEFFTHLLDGSRAANRAGWQWTVGTGNAKSYGFARWQVEKRAPGLCASCARRHSCPIQNFPNDRMLAPIEPAAGLRFDNDLQSTSGPSQVQCTGEAEVVWLTAESLGDDDPALAANPTLPAVFVFDEPLLSRLGLSGKRLIFLAERLAELGEARRVEVYRGKPGEVLDRLKVAATFAPVPGWKRIAAEVEPVEIHPWSWLRRPGAGSLMSFSAWNGRNARAVKS